MSRDAAPHSFLTTHWSLVHRAVSKHDPDAQAALAQLCGACWFPIYAYIRRSGKSPHDAEDLTQGFFARLIEKNFLATADGDKGRLRTFLLTCVQRHLADEHDRAMTQKRGGGRIVELDAFTAEQRLAAEPADELTPERYFQRRWALGMVDTAMRALEAEYAAQDKAALFEKLRPFLGFTASVEENYQATADALGMKLNTVKSHIRRLREQWRDLLMQQVAATLDDPTPETIKAELAELIACV
ncbi:MAG: sigma-70 family RNA polymerase sigma factor [Chthoniobacteraceae bacterium]